MLGQTKLGTKLTRKLSYISIMPLASTKMLVTSIFAVFFIACASAYGPRMNLVMSNKKVAILGATGESSKPSNSLFHFRNE